MTQYIDKAALVAKIGRYISNYKEIVVKTDRNDSTWVDSVSMIDAKIDVLQHLLSFLDTLETKEVDLEREIDRWICYAAITHEDCSIDDVIRTAKHFFELGLNTRKGE